MRRGLLAEKASCFLKRVLQIRDERAKGNRLNPTLCCRVCSAVAPITKDDASILFGRVVHTRSVSPFKQKESTWRSAEDP
jgi:hypothetical protein